MISSLNNKIYFLEKKYDLRIKLFILGIFLVYLDSYTLFGVPYSWIGLMVCTVLSIYNKIMPFKKLFWSMIVLIFILIFITTIQYKDNNAPINFIILRFINLIAFLIIVNFIVIQNFRNNFILKLENNLIILGTFFSILAIISFYLNMFNFNEINIVEKLKNRISTGGSIEVLTNECTFFDNYSSMCHRALGTFREPSLLAISLVLPFFLAIKNYKYFSILLIGLGIYLTYSLSILFAILSSITLSLLIADKNYFFSKKILIFFLLVSFSIYILHELSIFSSNIYYERITTLLENNSRDYIYKNLHIILGNYWTGNGVGFGFFNLSDHIFKGSENIFNQKGNIVPTSFLSLPLNYLSAGGILGLFIISFWVLCHNLFCLKYLNVFNRNLYLLLCISNTFLFLYFSSAEELHIWHAIALGICLNFLNFNKKKID